MWGHCQLQRSYYDETTKRSRAKFTLINNRPTGKHIDIQTYNKSFKLFFFVTNRTDRYFYAVLEYAIVLILTLTARDRLQSSEPDVCGRQILTTKVNPRTVRIKIFLLAVDP